MSSAFVAGTRQDSWVARLLDDGPRKAFTNLSSHPTSLNSTGRNRSEFASGSFLFTLTQSPQKILGFSKMHQHKLHKREPLTLSQKDRKRAPL